uniref:Uncharacterized protein n=1 Tax=Tetranychus urticae TaxID=32264 RepID=T1KVF3_TETUR
MMNEKKRAEWTSIGVLMKNDYCHLHDQHLLLDT